MAKTAIVVPTLCTRNHYLIEALKSIRQAGDAYIVVITPNLDLIRSHIDLELYDELLLDPLFGLPHAINHAVMNLPRHIEYLNWLGDDDLVSPESIEVGEEYLDSNSRISCVYGACQYIDERGLPIWLNRSGRFAIKLMRFGPQLISQPGLLIRRSSFQDVGGLNCSLKWAFDLDLLIRLHRVGPFHYFPTTRSSFRWHQSSMSVRERKRAVVEASNVRRISLPRVLQSISIIWEFPLRHLILLSGTIMSSRAIRRSVSATD